MNALAPNTPATLVLRGGVVLVMNEAASRASAIAVRGGEIVAVGTDAEISMLVGPETRVVELAGRAVLPGINDSHLHGSWLGARWPHTLFGDMNPETASGLPAKLVDTREERRAAILRTAELLAAAGITSYTEPGIGPGEDDGETGCFHSEVIEIYRELAAAGELRQRVTLLALYGVLDGPSDVDTVVAGIRSHARVAGVSDPRWFSVPGIKVFGDLIPLSRHAWTAHGYEDGTHGDLLIEGESIEAKASGLAAIVREAHLAGLQVGVHATGDRTIGLVLDTIEAAAAEPGAPAARDARHVIIHGDLATPDQVEQIARLGAFLNTQSGIAALTADWLVGALGEDVANLAWQLEVALEAGVLALSSDAPVLGFDWRRGIADADARILRMREAAGVLVGVGAGAAAGVGAAAGLDAAAGVGADGGVAALADDDDAAARLHGLLRAYTAVPAAQDHAESWKGTLEAGKVADLVVLARDPFEVGAAGLPEVEVDVTVVDGRVVFERA
ncbi:amidohydrolase family protein [Leucobacter sp. HY1910]